MTIRDPHWTDLALKIIGALLLFLSFRWVSHIFRGRDRKWTQKEWIMFTAYCFFIWAAAYILYKEGNRPANSAHIFSDLIVVFVFVSLLTVLHLQQALDMVVKILTIIRDIRSGKAGSSPPDEMSNQVKSKMVRPYPQDEP